MFDYQERIEALINNEIAAGEIAGANLMVIKGGEEKFFQSFGQMDLEYGKPMKRDTIFRMFSMSKPITACATMILEERGELDLRDAVSKYLPEFAGQKVWTKDGLVDAERDITIWDCLNMTTGIPYPHQETEVGRQMHEVVQGLIQDRKAGKVADTREYARRIASVPLMFQPGEKWLYGFSADILGAVIEVVSGKRYSQFLQDEIFTPLNMVDTGFFVPEEKLDRFHAHYEYVEGKGLTPFKDSHLGEYYGEDVAFESGGAGLVSTIDDYSHFAMMMVNKGIYNGTRILGEKTVEFMSQDRLSEVQKVDYIWDSTRGYGYGCLMRVLIDQGQAHTLGDLGEYGWDGWTGNYVTMNPKENMVFLYFIQRAGAGFTPLARKLRDVTYANLQAWK